MNLSQRKNEFLVFEEGPSVDVVLQWATYRDASDQTSLSRIWGGIHPPVDDIPGRIIGIEVGLDAFALAERYFAGDVVTSVKNNSSELQEILVYPNPSHNGFLTVKVEGSQQSLTELRLTNLEGKLYRKMNFQPAETLNLNVKGLAAGVYLLEIIRDNFRDTRRIILK